MSISRALAAGSCLLAAAWPDLSLAGGVRLAFLHGPACAYAALSTTYDGCAGAPTTGSAHAPYLEAFASSVTQSGQTSTIHAHPMPYDVPWADYPVGYRTDVALKDASTATLPTGCTYNPTGSTPNTGPGSVPGPMIVCQSIAQGAPQLQTVFIPPDELHPAGQTITNALVFDGWDFSPSDAGCIPVDIKQNVGSSAAPVNVVFRNYHWKTDQNCIGNQYDVQLDSLYAGNAYFVSGEFDGNAAATVSPFTGKQTMNSELADTRSTTGSLTVLYTYAHNCRSRCIGSSAHGDKDLEYNYGPGFVSVSDGTNVSGSISGTTLTVNPGFLGNIATGGFLQGPVGWGSNAYINYQISGTPNGAGTYNISVSQNVASFTGLTVTVEHGEFFLDSSQTSITNQIQAHNLVVVPNTQPAVHLGDSCTAAFYVTVNGSNASTISNAVLDSNVAVVNSTNGGAPCGGFAYVSYNTFTNLTVTNNYMDVTGALSCFFKASSPVFTNVPVFSGNKNMSAGNEAEDGFQTACTGHGSAP